MKKAICFMMALALFSLIVINITPITAYASSWDVDEVYEHNKKVRESFKDDEHTLDFYKLPLFAWFNIDGNVFGIGNIVRNSPAFERGKSAGYANFG